MPIYFVKPKNADGPIKIGCSDRPDLRLRVMNCDSPLPLEIIATFSGFNETERQLLRQFDHLHSHGSWFHAGDDLIEFLKAAQESGELCHLIDWSIKKGGHRSRVNTAITRAWNAKRREPEPAE